MFASERRIVGFPITGVELLGLLYDGRSRIVGFGMVGVELLSLR